MAHTEFCCDSNNQWVGPQSTDAIEIKKAAIELVRNYSVYRGLGKWIQLDIGDNIKVPDADKIAEPFEQLPIMPLKINNEYS